jgi:hypothetical protein
LVTNFPKRKTLQSTCHATLQLTCGMWIMTVSDPEDEPVYSSTDMQRRLVREAHLAEEIGWCVSSF